MAENPTPEELEMMRKLTAQAKVKSTTREQTVSASSEQLSFDCLGCNKPILVPQPVQKQIAEVIGEGGASVWLVATPRPIKLPCPNCNLVWGIYIEKAKGSIFKRD